MKSATHATGWNAVRRFIDTYDIDIVHFEHFWFTKYSFDIHPSIKKVIVYHDLHHDVFKQFAKMEKKLVRKMLHLAESFKFYMFEHLLEKHVSMKVFLNPIEMLSLPTNSVHIPHVVNSDIFYKPARETRSFNILFLGSYNHQPNRTSFEYIVKDICPKLNVAGINLKIHVFGSSTENFAPLLENSPHFDLFTIHGFAKDINHAFEKMDVALFPILNGGGIKTKIIDSLASGVPVVTTPEGIEGLHDLPGNCIGVGETPQELADEIERLMGDFALRADRSQIGREYVEKEFSFPAFSKKVQKNYLELIHAGPAQ
jgi:glycosyltransferase involved in cell wall biosynthesis